MTDFNQEYIDYFGSTLGTVQSVHDHFQTMSIGDEVLLSELVDITGNPPGETFGGVTYLIIHHDIAYLKFYEVVNGNHVEVTNKKYIFEV